MKALAKVTRSGERAVATVSSQLRRVPKQLRRVGSALVTARGKTERLIKKNPLRAVAGASALGFVLAKVRR
ncbi:MAG: hypothetical protein JWM82_551 [Myxococcales bacterium]|nr:hypothetical protein [Myxococcales bacterium]